MGIRKHPVVWLCGKPGGQPQGWAGLCRTFFSVPHQNFLEFPQIAIER